MRKLVTGLVAVVMALGLSLPARAVTLTQLCLPGNTGGLSFQTRSGNGTLFTDSNGCVSFDMDKDPNGSDMSAMVRAGFVNMGQAAVLPWGSTAPVTQTGGTPTDTMTATALAAINVMTANVSSLTMAGMTAGTRYLVVWLQDGTGSRTLTQTAITGAPALTAAEKAANGYAVWLVSATSASAAAFLKDYPNRPMYDIYMSDLTTAGTAITGGTAQAQATMYIPGLTTSHGCIAVPNGALDATWSTDFVRGCIPGTNVAQLSIVNPGGPTTTPSASVFHVRLVK
jgi:hypothetical protein